MKYINTKSKDVYYNLAVEEFVFNHCTEDDYLLLWVNEPCVVIGKYQNIYQEVNTKELFKNKIYVSRRNSGGGTVYHDEGNLNFSLIKDHNPSTFSGYEEFLDPIIKILNDLNIPAKKRNSCDIVVGEKKISGNAQASKKNRILHHGTLLFNSDLNVLRTTLKPVQGEFESKAVKSVRSSVGNISDYLRDQEMGIKEFQSLILQKLFPNGVDERELTMDDIRMIKEIEKKYCTWEWIYGKSPQFTLKKEACFNNHVVIMTLLVEKGIIKECLFKSQTLDLKKVETAARGQIYDYSILKRECSNITDFENFAEILF